MSSRVFSVLILIALGILWFFYWVYIYVPWLEKQKEELITDSKKNEISLTPIGKIDEIDSEITMSNIEWTWSKNDETISSQDRINNIKTDLKSYKVIELWNNKFNFNNNENSLDLYLNSKFVFNFPIVSKESIDIKKIYSSDNEFFINIDWKYYIYSFTIDKIIPLDINLWINYIKKDDNLYLLNTEKWIFVFNQVKNTIEYNDTFADFVYYKDWYVWIINSGDDRRQKNLWIYPQRQNSIFFYNPSNKQKKILYSTNLNLTKIYNNLSEIYFEEDDENLYKLENF